MHFGGDKFYFIGQTLFMRHEGEERQLGELEAGVLLVVRKREHWFRKFSGWGFNIYLFKKRKKLGIKLIELHAVLPEGGSFVGVVKAKKVESSLASKKALVLKNSVWDTQVILRPGDFKEG